MTRFHGKVGFGDAVELRPGVTQENITEKPYFGEVIQPSRQAREGEKVNDDFSVGSSVSILADAYVNEHILAIRYVVWLGVRWKVTEVVPSHPRLLLRLGGVYNGPEPAPAPDTP